MEVAVADIQHGTGFGGVGGFGFVAGANSTLAVRVLMVPEVLRLLAGFMLATGGHHRSAELERQQNQQENHQPMTHQKNGSNWGLRR